jgi:hypothetical protein
MSLSQSSIAAADFVASAPVRSNVLARRGATASEAFHSGADRSLAQHGVLQRRDRRVAFALMAGSSLLSIAALGGAWELLRSVI